MYLPNWFTAAGQSRPYYRQSGASRFQVMAVMKNILFIINFLYKLRLFTVKKSLDAVKFVNSVRPVPNGKGCTGCTYAPTHRINSEVFYINLN